MATKISSGGRLNVVFATLYFVWWALWCLLQILVLQEFGVLPARASVDALVSNTLLAATCLLITNNMRYYLPKREKYWYVLVISFVLSCLWLFLVRVSLWGLYKNDSAYMSALSLSSGIRFVIAFLTIGCCTLLSLLWFTQQYQQADNQRKHDMERLAREAELNKLRQQLQPHFLFNSLNSISALTGTQPEKARHMIQQLSDFLRGTLKTEGQQWTTLEEDLQYLHLYLEIEKLRFGYRLQTEIECEAEALDLKLPAMLLQPLVENAIKFGLYDTIGAVVILIKARKWNDALEVTVQNPFDESTSLPVKGTGFGLASIKRRLFLLFSRYDLLQVKKEDEQFITIITIPQLDESNYH